MRRSSTSPAFTRLPSSAYFFGHDAPFLGSHLHGGNRTCLPSDTDIVVEVRLFRRGDVQDAAVYFQHAMVFAENNPTDKGG